MLIKREKKSLTFMIIPHSSNSVFNVQISYKIIYLAAFVLISTTTIVFNLVWNYNRLKTTPEELQQVQREKAEVEAHLEGEVVDLHEDAQDLADQLREIKNEADVLGDIIGVDNEEISETVRDRERRVSLGIEVSRAMSPELYMLRRSIAQIEMETQVQTRTFEELIEIARAKKEKLAHTPSMWPNDSKRISSSFGWRRNPISGRQEFHKALDIIGVYGDPLYTTAAGVVVKSEYDGGYGYVVVVDHGNGFKTKYAHCSKILTREGQKVNKGETIARMGSTGYSTGTHVHYEVWLNGEAVDPTDYLELGLRDMEI